MAVADFGRLMEPGQMGSLRLKNRIIKTAAGSGYAPEGDPTDQMAAYYSSFAKGGVSLIIIENCGVEWPRGTHFIPRGFRFHDDDCIPSHARMVDEIHKYDCPVFLQLMHAGCWLEKFDGMGNPERLSVSRIDQKDLPSDAWVPGTEMTVPLIHELVEAFAKGAERAKKAGYDGVEINGSYYHLINMFLSRFWNRRHDEYGCDTVENMTRFYCEAIREAKRLCGKDYPIATNINGTEYGLKNGITLEEAKEMAPFIEAAGADFLQVRATGYYDYMSLLLPDHLLYPNPPALDMTGLDVSKGGKGIFVPLAAAVKQKVKIPVACAGRLDPMLGEQLLREGKIDFVGMTRRLVADPELPNKVASGRLKEIRPCAGCGYCVETRKGDSPMKCRINATAGREREYTLKPAEKKKRVLIVGAGLAGMEAARVAAERGHKVTLCDKAPRLGGLVPLAGLVKGGELESLVDVIAYYENQIGKLGVELKLGTNVDSATVRSLKPDVVLLGTGGANQTPDIPGIENRKVVKSEQLHGKLKLALKFFSPKTLQGLTKMWMPLGRRVIIIGGGIQGCQLAHFLAERARKVTIVDSAPQLGAGMPYQTAPRLFRWFGQNGVDTLAGVTYEKISDEGLTLKSREGERRTIEADSIVLALPLMPDNGFCKALEKEGLQVLQIGDCREFGLMHGAVADGARVGHSI